MSAAQWRRAGGYAYGRSRRDLWDAHRAPSRLELRYRATRCTP